MTKVYGIFVNNGFRYDLGLYPKYDHAFKVAYKLSLETPGDNVTVDRLGRRLAIFGQKFHTIITIEPIVIYDDPREGEQDE